MGALKKLEVGEFAHYSPGTNRGWRLVKDSDDPRKREWEFVDTKTGQILDKHKGSLSLGGNLAEWTKGGLRNISEFQRQAEERNQRRTDELSRTHYQVKNARGHKKWVPKTQEMLDRDNELEEMRLASGGEIESFDDVYNFPIGDPKALEKTADPIETLLNSARAVLETEGQSDSSYNFAQEVLYGAYNKKVTNEEIGQSDTWYQFNVGNYKDDMKKYGSTNELEDSNIVNNELTVNENDIEEKVNNNIEQVNPDQKLQNEADARQKAKEEFLAKNTPANRAFRDRFGNPTHTEAAATKWDEMRWKEHGLPNYESNLLKK